MKSGHQDEKTSDQQPPSRGKHAGTVPVLYRKIIEARQEKGWGQRTLAKEADCSLATIKSIESGKEAFPSTIEKVGKPLGLKLVDLEVSVAEASEPAVPASSGRRVLEKIITKADFDTYDETEASKFIEAICEQNNIQGNVIVIIIERSSVAIVLELDESDATAIIRSLGTGDISGFSRIIGVGIRVADRDAETGISSDAQDALVALKTASNRFRFLSMDDKGFHIASKRYRFKDNYIQWCYEFLVRIYGDRTPLPHFRIILYIYPLFCFLIYMLRAINMMYAGISPAFLLEDYAYWLDLQATAKDGEIDSDWWLILRFWSIVISNLVNISSIKFLNDELFKSFIIGSFAVNVVALLMYELL